MKLWIVNPYVHCGRGKLGQSKVGVGERYVLRHMYEVFSVMEKWRFKKRLDTVTLIAVVVLEKLVRTMIHEVGILTDIPASTGRFKDKGGAEAMIVMCQAAWWQWWFVGSKSYHDNDTLWFGLCALVRFLWVVGTWGNFTGIWVVASRGLKWATLILVLLEQGRVRLGWARWAPGGGKVVSWSWGVVSGIRCTAHLFRASQPGRQHFSGSPNFLEDDEEFSLHRN